MIDAEAHKRIAEYIQIGKQEAKCVLEMAAPRGGFFIGPAIFRDVDPRSRIAQEEIFGPVLSVLKAEDFDHALAIANDSEFALTGGIFSRSPAHIEQARKDFRVGNLYINRGITGAVVERQPFGGLKLSGIGSKAGGPDYLLQFVEPRTVSENTLAPRIRAAGAGEEMNAFKTFKPFKWFKSFECKSLTRARKPD